MNDTLPPVRRVRHCRKFLDVLEASWEHGLHMLDSRVEVWLFLATSIPGGKTTISDYPTESARESVQSVLRAAQSVSNDVDMVAIGYRNTEAEGGSHQDRLTTLIHERGARCGYHYDQDVTKPRFLFRRWRRVGAPRLVRRVGPLTGEPLAGTVAATVLAQAQSPEALLVALKRVAAYGDQIPPFLESLDSAATEGFRRILRGETCTLARLVAVCAERLALVDPERPDSLSVELPTEEERDRAVSDHADAGDLVLSSFFASTIRRRILAIQSGIDAKREIEQAPKAIDANPALAAYWRELASCGWLDEVPLEHLPSLRVRLVRQFVDDPANLHYALASVRLDPLELGEMLEIIEGYAAAAYRRVEFAGARCRLAGDDIDSAVPLVVLRWRGRRGRFRLRPRAGIEDLHDCINDMLASFDEPARFFLLPSTDPAFRPVYVAPSVYSRAEATGLIPSEKRKPMATWATRYYLRLLRRFQVKGAVELSDPVVVGAEGLYACDTSGDIVKLDKATFSQEWAVPSRGYRAEVESQGVVVLHRGNGLRLLEAATGADLWSSRGPSGARIWNDMVLEWQLGGLRLAHLRTGKTLRQILLDGVQPQRLLVTERLLLYGPIPDSAPIVVVDLSTGEAVWSGDLHRILGFPLGYETPNKPRFFALESGRFLAFRGQTIVLVQTNDTADPTVVWRAELTSPARHVTRASGRLFCVGDRCFLAGIDGASGAILFEGEQEPLLGGACLSHSPPVVFQEWLLMHTSAGLGAFRLRDGALEAQYFGDAAVGRPSVLGDAFLVASGSHISVFGVS